MTTTVPCFADQLAAAVRRCGNPVVVGLDPRMDRLPAEFQSQDQGDDLQARANAFRKFCCRVIDVVAPLVPAIKPQAAFFEQLGPAGMTTLADVIRYGKNKGLLVILDGKRNDIGSTAMAYAHAYLGANESAWGADALTVNPYLGDDSLSPFVDVALKRCAGIFVLVKTSNPGGARFQDLVAEQIPVYQHVAQHVADVAARSRGDAGYSSIGAVVGATYPQQLRKLREDMPHCWLLVPGFGSQGGTASDVASAFDSQGLGAIINNSRGIIFAHARAEFRDRFGPPNWQAAVEAATLDMIERLASETAAGRLKDV